jgi:amidase
MNESELCFLPAREMVAMIERREISSVELVDAHLTQIDRYNESVNAVVTRVDDEARANALLADKQTMSGESTGLLHGLPIAHKDTHRTKGIRTTFGSPLFIDHVPTADDLIIDRLHHAGAISIGKTNTPEFAAGSHTFNSVFGATHNPYDLGRTPGGSSGGAAVALALGMHPLADGSDMGGSLRNPASFCNVVGLRPSFGRVPGYPSGVPEERLSTPGAMARSVGDVALMMQAISGPDPRVDNALTDSPRQFTHVFDGVTKRLRVAWTLDLGGLFGVEDEVRNALSICPQIFEQLGWEVVEEVPDLRGADETFRTLRAAQFAHLYGPLVDRSPDLLKETIRWNVAIGRDLTSEQITKAKHDQDEIVERMRIFFSTIDLLALPVSQVAPFPIEWEYPKVVDHKVMSDYLEWMASCYLLSVTKLPAISVPAGFTSHGLPVGLQLVAPPNQDLFLLQAAHAFEQNIQLDKRPALIH